MANIEERIRRVLKGLEICGSLGHDCGVEGCPYQDEDEDVCFSVMNREAHGLIVELDRLLQQHQEAAAAGTSSDCLRQPPSPEGKAKEATPHDP